MVCGNPSKTFRLFYCCVINKLIEWSYSRMALVFRRCPLLRHYVHNLKTFKAAAASKTFKKNLNTDSLRTTKTDPGEHTLEDVGKFYQIPYDLAIEHLFKEGGYPTEFKNNTITFHEACLMVRKPGLEIIHYLKNADYTRPINKYVLYGRNGVGKSLILCYLIHYAYLHNWLIVHLPWVPQWLSKPTEVTNSQSMKGMVDLNIRATQWLLHFKIQNAKILNDKQVQNSYQWNVRESTKAGDSFLNVTEYGISRGSVSSEVILVLLKEIKLLCRDGKAKCLVFIDGFNALFHSKSNIKNSDKVIMPPDKVTVLNAFRDMALPDWHNGAAILTCDSLAVVGHNKYHLPLYQLTLKGYEYIYPFIPINVPQFTELEVNNMLGYYLDRKWLRDERGFDELKALSCNNGYELMKICNSL